MRLQKTYQKFYGRDRLSGQFKKCPLFIENDS